MNRKRRRTNYGEQVTFNKDRIEYETDKKCTETYVGKGLTHNFYQRINSSEGDMLKHVPSCYKEHADFIFFTEIRKKWNDFCMQKCLVNGSVWEGFNRFLLGVCGNQSNVENVRQGLIPTHYNKILHGQNVVILSNELIAEIPMRLRRNRFRKPGDFKFNFDLYERKVSQYEQSGFFQNKETLSLLKTKLKELSNEIRNINEYNPQHPHRHRGGRGRYYPQNNFQPEPPQYPPPPLSSHPEQQKQSEPQETIHEKLSRLFEELSSIDKSFKKEIEVYLTKSGTFSEYFDSLFMDMMTFLNEQRNTEIRKECELVTLDERSDDDVVYIQFKYPPKSLLPKSSSSHIDEVSILRKHFDKLERFYNLHVNIDHEEEEGKKEKEEKEKSKERKRKKYFKNCLYCIVKRYRSFFGHVEENQNRPLGEGTAFHAAAPEHVFRFLERTIGVKCEIFASPFNCFFPRFCSVFADTDVFFGSYGSYDYFVKNIEKGSFEVGPPYTIELQQRSAEVIIEKLKEKEHSTDCPLSFIFFVAEWRDPVAEYHVILDHSKFTRLHFGLQPNEHYYISGGQHIPEPKTTGQKRKRNYRKKLRRYYTVPHGTHVYVLQNEEGMKKYKIPVDFKEQLVAIFKEHAKKERLYRR